MKIEHGKGTTEYGPGVSIHLDGDEVAMAIAAWLVARGVNVCGPRTITVNGGLCERGHIYVDPSGYVVADGEMIYGCGACPSATCSPPDWERVKWRQLQAGERVEMGDWVDMARDGWRDDPKWVPATNIGEAAPDPAYPSHRIFRRILEANAHAMARDQ